MEHPIRCRHGLHLHALASGRLPLGQHGRDACRQDVALCTVGIIITTEYPNFAVVTPIATRGGIGNENNWTYNYTSPDGGIIRICCRWICSPCVAGGPMAAVLRHPRNEL